MKDTITCKNCNQVFRGNFCPQCGQSSHEGRINAHYILHDIPHSVFHVDKGFLHTFLALFTRPGKMVTEYLEGKRAKYFKPFAYVILMSTVCTLLVNWIAAATEFIYLKYNPNEVIQHRAGFFKHYFSVFIFIMIPFASLATYWCFYKHKYNYWEHFMTNTYIAAQLNIMQVLLYLAGLIAVLSTHAHNGINFATFISLFMTAFLYMYGVVFGNMMKENHKPSI